MRFLAFVAFKADSRIPRPFNQRGEMHTKQRRPFVWCIVFVWLYIRTVNYHNSTPAMIHVVSIHFVGRVEG